MKSAREKPARQKPEERPKEKIGFTTGLSSFGTVLVAFSAHGVVALLIGADVRRLLRELRVLFPNADLREEKRESAGALKRVLKFIETPGADLDLPLDFRGTPFQRRVWNEVRKVPAGETVTYKDIAERIGAPRAMRAVGSACAQNRFAFAVPCQRVTRSNGALSRGWPSGPRGQKALIAREAIKPKTGRKSRRA